MKLPIELDKRYKIHPDKYEEIRKRYKRLKSARKVAKLYGVDHSTILMIVSEKYRENRKMEKSSNWKFTPKYVRRTLNTLYVRSIRARKKKYLEEKNEKMKK